MNKSYVYKTHNKPIFNLNAAIMTIGIYKVIETLKKGSFDLSLSQLVVLSSIYLMRLGDDKKYTIRKLLNFMRSDDGGLDMDINHGTLKNIHRDLLNKGYINKCKGTIRFELAFKTIEEVFGYLSYNRNFVAKKQSEYKKNYRKF